jgi:N utilization substance protein B
MAAVSPTDPRHKAREVALQCLFAMDAKDSWEESPLDWLLIENPLPRKAVAYAQELVQGVKVNLSELDELIHKYAPAWPVSQLSLVDRNILRIALFELIYHDQVPRKTAVNEAVELAKVFGSESSSRFVNGVVGSVITALESGNVPVGRLVTEGR